MTPASAGSAPLAALLGADRGRRIQDGMSKMQKTRALRGATAGLEMSAVAADRFVDTAKPLALQASSVARRFGLPPATAAAVAALAFNGPETWRAAR